MEKITSLHSATPSKNPTHSIKQAPFSLTLSESTATVEGSVPLTKESTVLIEHDPLSLSSFIVSQHYQPEQHLKLIKLLEQTPALLTAVQFSYSVDGWVIQAFPALTNAALQGMDPLTWVPILCELGASWSLIEPMQQAQLMIMNHQRQQFKKISLMRRQLSQCTHLSLWILSAAEALYPEAALHALNWVRTYHPSLISSWQDDFSFFSDYQFLKPTMTREQRFLIFMKSVGYSC